MLKAAVKAAEVVADLEDDKVPADEHVVEIVRVDLEQDRGHSSMYTLREHAVRVAMQRREGRCNAQEDLLFEKVIFSVGVADVIVIIHPVLRVRPQRRGGP